MRRLLMVALLLLLPSAQPQHEPTVRIGLNQNASAVMIRSAVAFSVEQHSTRSATFAPVLTLNAGAAGGMLKTSNLQYRMAVELDKDVLLAVPLDTHLRIEPSGSPFEIENRA